MSATVSRHTILICRPTSGASASPTRSASAIARSLNEGRSNQQKDKNDETACAHKIVGNFARRAFRRPVTDEDLNPLMRFYKTGYANGGFEKGVREAVTAILASPHFLYRAEAGNAAGGERALSDLELASRLSFFLWSSLPD